MDVYFVLGSSLMLSTQSSNHSFHLQKETREKSINERFDEEENQQVSVRCLQAFSMSFVQDVCGNLCQKNTEHRALFIDISNIGRKNECGWLYGKRVLRSMMNSRGFPGSGNQQMEVW